MQLDRYDRQLLDVLQQDGRISNQDLADRIALSPSSCLRRLRALEEAGLILGYRALLDAKKLGLALMALIHISMDRHTPERFTRFEAEVGAIAEVLECLLITGQDADYQLKVVVADNLAEKIDDDRVKVAIPVYGCGFLDENSAWLTRFEQMGAGRTKRWCDQFDPSRYLPGVSCPILFVNGTNDFAYPLDSYQKSYRLVEGPVDLCVTVGMPHGHPQGWAPKVIGLFVDSVLKGGLPPPRLATPAIEDGRISAQVAAGRRFESARLHYTTDSGPWQERSWSTIDAETDGSRVRASLPEDRPIVAFFTVEDERGAVASSPHVSAEK